MSLSIHSLGDISQEIFTGLMQGRIVIPLHNEQGELVGYAGRWPGEPPEGEPKYKFPPKFHKSAVLFNLRRVDASEVEDKGLIIV